MHKVSMSHGQLNLILFRQMNEKPNNLLHVVRKCSMLRVLNYRIVKHGRYVLKQMCSYHTM
jgi:hypothetical protein